MKFLDWFHFACYVPVCLKKKHNACKAVWFTKATVHRSNLCIFVDGIDSQIILRMIRESTKGNHLNSELQALINELQNLCKVFKWS